VAAYRFAHLHGDGYLTNSHLPKKNLGSAGDDSINLRAVVLRSVSDGEVAS
jgi:hypothetical protein